MRKRMLSILLACTMVLTMVGCGTKEAASEPEAKPAASEAPAKAAEDDAQAATDAAGGGEDIMIGISMCAIESQMWAEYQTAMHKKCDELGVKYTEVIAENDV